MSTGLTTTNTGLATANNNQLSAEDEAAFKKLAGGGGKFFARLQLFAGASEPVKEGLFTANHYGVATGKDTITDVGKEVEVAPIAMRFKAMDLRDVGQPLSYHKFSSPEFQTIHQLADVADSHCMSGTEFLVWVPAAKEFCTFYAANISSKREAPKIRALIGKVATFKSVYVKRPKNSFQAIKIVESSSPLESVPSQEDLDDAVERFNNPVDSKVTTASADVADATSRAQ